MRADGRADTLILVARALCEGTALAGAAALLHAMLAARTPLPLMPATAAAFGTTLVLTALLRERGTTERSVALTALVVGGGIAVSLLLPARPVDALQGLTRIIAFGLLGEAYLWRVITLARGPLRWRDVRRGVYLALAALALDALIPGPIDRDPLPALALASGMAGGIALSLSRSVEELTLGTHQIAGRASGGAASGSAFVIGALALVVAAFLPAAQVFVSDSARVLGPLLERAVFLILLPLGYVAAWVVYLVLWLRNVLGIGEFPLPQVPRRPFGDDSDLEQRLREMEQQRPLIFGAVEIVIGLIGLVVAVVIVARLIDERRARTSAGVEIARERADAIGLGATLRQLFPARAARRQPPADDGTPAGHVRRMYWRLLEIAERNGPGRRAPAETPAEHERRLLLAGERWAEASAIVRAFEDVRYAEAEPDGATVDRARAALQRVEATS